MSLAKSLTNRSKPTLLAVGAANLLIVFVCAALALSALRDVRALADPAPYRAVQFSMMLVLALISAQSLGTIIGQLIAGRETPPEVAALERRVAELEQRLARAAPGA